MLLPVFTGFKNRFAPLLKRERHANHKNPQSNFLKYSIRAVFVIFVLAAAFVLIARHANNITDVALSNNDYSYLKSIALPHSGDSDAHIKERTYVINLDHKNYGSTHWHVIGDDCIRNIKVNNVSIDLNKSKGNACDYKNGIKLDFAPYIKSGNNNIIVAVEDSGGKYGLYMMPIELFISIIPYAFCFFFMLCLCRFLEKKQVDFLSIGLFVTSALLSLHYLYISNDGAVTNDLGWHMNYIYYIYDNWLKPYGYSTWTSNHPPVYYYVAAATIRLNDLFLGLPAHKILRFLSWIFFMIFHVFNVLTIRRAGFSGIQYYCCVALLLLWPGNAHLASKINSEAMYYMWAAITFYFTLAWYKEGKPRNLMFAVLAVGMAMTVRTNAVILVMLIGSLVLVSLCRKRLSLRYFLTRAWGFTALLLALCLLVAFGGLIFYRSDDLLVGLTSGYSDTFVFRNHLTLSYALDIPFNDWNRGILEYFLRTSMFGEYVWTSPALAIAMNCFVAAIFWYAVLPWLFATRTELRGMLPYILYLFASGIFVLYFCREQIRVPQAGDVRYIYPALICLIFLYGKSYAFYHQRGAWILTWLGPTLAFGFSLLSTYYFWNNYR